MIVTWVLRIFIIQRWDGIYFYPWLSMCGSFRCGLNAMATFHAFYFCYKKLVGLDLTRGFKVLEDYNPKVGIFIDSSFVYDK